MTEPGAEAGGGLGPQDGGEAPWAPPAHEASPAPATPPAAPAEPAAPEAPAPDAEPAAAGEPSAPAARGRTALETLRDNLEAVAFALVLALLLRHFAIEVFKIPTGSMEPTLHGDDSASHPNTPGDRVLVDKAAYLWRGVSRWDVLVFRYPLDWSRNFIKRCVGLPGEGLRIERGDVWAGPWKGPEATVLHPARKPRRVREELYVPVYPPAASVPGRPSDWWREDSPGAAAFHATAHGRLEYAGDASPADRAPAAVLEYAWPIRDTDGDDDDPRSSGGRWFLVPDVRVRARVTATGPAEVELSWSPGDGRRHELRLASEGRPGSEVRTASASWPIPHRLEPGQPTEIELESVDGDLRAWVDGREARVVPDEIPMAEAARIEALGETGLKPVLRVAVRGAPLALDEVRVDHDLYYVNHRLDPTYLPHEDDTLRLGPQDHFMLGDNTRSSSDSRRWTANGVRLRDGTEILWEWQTYPRSVEEDNRRVKEVVDTEGVARRWAAEDEAEDGAITRRLPFVARDRIVGRAWFALVFWPLDNLGRIRFIH